MMSKDSRLSVKFQEPDVVSAQRMRFIRSTRLKVIAGIWAAAILFGIGLLLFPVNVPEMPYLTSQNLFAIALVFAGVVIIFYWIAPLIDFHTNPIWKSPFTLQFNQEQLMLSLEGRSKGVYIRWDQIRNVHENDRAYILYTSSEDNFLILPRSVFTDPQAEERFRQHLGKDSSLKPGEKERFLKA